MLVQMLGHCCCRCLALEHVTRKATAPVCTVILHVPSVYVGIFTKDVCIMMKYLGNITDDIDSFHLYL